MHALMLLRDFGLDPAGAEVRRALALVRDRHTQVMTQRVNYASITQPAVHPQAAANAVLPGQVDLLDLPDPTPTVHHEPDHQEIP